MREDVTDYLRSLSDLNVENADGVQDIHSCIFKVIDYIEEFAYHDLSHASGKLRETDIIIPNFKKVHKRKRQTLQSSDSDEDARPPKRLYPTISFGSQQKRMREDDDINADGSPPKRLYPVISFGSQQKKMREDDDINEDERPPKRLYPAISFGSQQKRMREDDDINEDGRPPKRLYPVISFGSQRKGLREDDDINKITSTLTEYYPSRGFGALQKRVRNDDTDEMTRPLKKLHRSVSFGHPDNEIFNNDSNGSDNKDHMDVTT
ncbi:hypothetical protein UCRPC4_g00110 [Phaeomoniella chlamydospora]|uniref:Uncharacterized protein n=1 Tax=Phaeomoniella chlamydospora TaxID=158046 RepID=A0A0G2F4M9_PHACM|nr:hypothetical protein UCRPC4_g00110 [Phaeomoniella chlamydospora]